MNALYEWARPLVLRVLKVPHDPHPPAGSPGSLQVFRAGRSFYRLRLGIWAFRQCGVLIAFILGLLFLHGWLLDPPDFLRNVGPFAFFARQPEFVERYHVGTILLVMEISGLALALLQLPFSYAVVRMDYEYRWYMVTDRSLRIRTGLGTVRETTFSFANIQQIQVEQGPVQRWLGLADVVVTTAGGGAVNQATQHSGHPHNEPMHQGRFHCVENAEQIRDLILQRLRQHKSAGLGDPDDPDHAPAAPAIDAEQASDLIQAATLLRDEARALRATVERSTMGGPQPS